MRVIWLQAEFVGDVPTRSAYMEKLPNDFRAEEYWTELWFLNIGQEYDLCVKVGVLDEISPGVGAELYPVSITVMGNNIREIDGAQYPGGFAKTRRFSSITDLFISWKNLQFLKAPKAHHDYFHRKVEIRLGCGFQIWPDDFTEDEKELLFPKIFG